MARIRLTKTQKAKNAVKYKAIKRAYKTLPDKKGLTYIQFKNRVLNMQGASKKDTWVGKKNLSITSAIKKVKQSTLFLPLEKRQVQNLCQGLKNKFPDQWEYVKSLCRKRNGQIGSPVEMIKWNEATGFYELTRDNGDVYSIDIDDSPVQCIISPVLIKGDYVEVPW